MFTKNEELNQAVREETDISEEDLKRAIKIIIDIEPKILCIDSMQEVNANAIDREREERKKDTGNIKNNYITRFDDVKSTLNIIFGRIEKIQEGIVANAKEQSKFLWGILLTFVSCSVFLYITMIWEKVISPLFR